MKTRQVSILLAILGLFLALSAGAQVTDVHVAEPSLENFFLHHTGRSLRD